MLSDYICGHLAI